jgi:hypothetical protein
MNRDTIKIENGIVYVPQSEKIQMTAYELAALFGCYVQTVESHIKTILKSGIVKADISCPLIVNSYTLIPEFYGFDMAIALAFRVHSPQAEILRQWIIRRVIACHTPLPPTLFIQLSKRALYN